MKKKELRKIRNSVLGRSLGVGKLGLKASLEWTGMKTGNWLLSKLPEDKKNALDEFMAQQAKRFVNELGQMKGSLMKAGQLLSTYGEHFLHPKALEVLKTLQSDSPPLEWPYIEKILQNELGEKLAELEINPMAYASASLGQVHRAKIKATGEQVAVKVQYSGLEKAIDSDLKILKNFMKFLAIVPKEFDFTPLFSEIKTMLEQELSYTKELELTEMYRKKVQLTPDLKVKIPKTFANYSSDKVLTTEFIDAHRLDSKEVKALSQEDRNALALDFLKIYYNELFVWKMVQTDPHFGNYLVSLTDGKPQLVSLDFGAVRLLSDSFVLPYKRMISNILQFNFSNFEQAATELNFLKEDDGEEIRLLLRKFCLLIVEAFLPKEHRTSPFYLPDGSYDFGASDLPKRVFQSGKELVLGFKFRTPPSELVFLDRKLGGVFVCLSCLGAKLDERELLLHYLRA